MSDATCPECGSTLAYNSLRGYTDCLNRDCVRCWYGIGGMTAKGIRATLQAELAREPVSHLSREGFVLPRELALRLVELLNDDQVES